MKDQKQKWIFLTEQDWEYWIAKHHNHKPQKTGKIHISPTELNKLLANTSKTEKDRIHCEWWANFKQISPEKAWDEITDWLSENQELQFVPYWQRNTSRKTLN